MILAAMLFRRVRQAAQQRSAAQGLTIDRNVFNNARSQLDAQITALRNLRSALVTSFTTLRTDWDSAAGRAFFNQFENQLLNHIDTYCGKLQQRSSSLNRVISEYNRVFEAADAVAQARYE